VLARWCDNRLPLGFQITFLRALIRTFLRFAETQATLVWNCRDHRLRLILILSETREAVAAVLNLLAELWYGLAVLFR